LIGGNDMLGGAEVAAFERDLELLARRVLSDAPAAVVMLELPQLPGYGRYGRAQRRVAAQYAVPIVHRKVLTAIMAAPENTVDGIHFNDQGNKRMAAAIMHLLRSK
jgi:lysophospholipase L1-like esterase